MPGRPRILLLAGDSQATAELLRAAPEVLEVPPSSDAPFAEDVQGVFLELGNPGDRARAEQMLQSAQILDSLADGVAVVGAELRVEWVNRTFANWSGGSPLGRTFYEALGATPLLPSDGCPFFNSLDGESETRRVQGRESRTFELHITPRGEGHWLVLCRDVTIDEQHHQQLEALHKAGRELAALDAEQLAEMSPEERIELLKNNIRRCTRDLLHYDSIDLRLLDRRTNELVPLLVEGLDPKMVNIRLLPLPEGNGITGRVAATGKSYLCRDTENDPLYIEGAPGMRSSMTVPLIYQDEIVGTFNVESPQKRAFDEQDVQFLEILGKEIASALHTLELLTAEKRETTTHAVEAIRSEVALPVDDILGAASALLERYIGVEADMADRLRLILRQARLIKQSIEKVGQVLAPPPVEEVAPPPFQGLRVLVVDNDERVRRVAHDILGRWGCVVETARDGREAILLARHSSYDAVLADIRLPDLAGYDAYRQLRSAQPQARMVLMTEYGYDPSHSLVKARQDGLKHVLFKPFRIDQLRDALTGCGSEHGASSS